MIAIQCRSSARGKLGWLGFAAVLTGALALVPTPARADADYTRGSIRIGGYGGQYRLSEIFLSYGSHSHRTHYRPRFQYRHPRYFRHHHPRYGRRYGYGYGHRRFWGPRHFRRHGYPHESMGFRDRHRDRHSFRHGHRRRF